MSISVTAPITQAIERAKLVTFRPFDVRKWFVLGFCAFLASLGEGSYSSGGGNGGSSGTAPAPPPAPVPAPAPIPAPVPGGPYTSVPAPVVIRPAGPSDTIRAWASTHRLEAVLLVVAVALLILAIYLLILWLSSRGKFMFTDGIARNAAEVVAPWKRFRRLGNSLFAFRAAIGAISTVGLLLVAALCVLIAWHDIQAQTFGGGAITAVAVGMALLLPGLLVFGLIDWCTTTFVTTIMYARDATVRPAWREFRRDVLAGHVGSLILFLLMRVLLSFAVGIAQLLLGCLTLCIGFLPYLSSVVALPLLVFSRAYAIYFLQQFGPQYVIMQEPAASFGFPVVMSLPAPMPAPPPLPPGVG